MASFVQKLLSSVVVHTLNGLVSVSTADHTRFLYTNLRSVTDGVFQFSSVPPLRLWSTRHDYVKTTVEGSSS